MRASIIYQIPLSIGLGEFEAHTAAREILEWIRTVLALHIEYRYRWRHFVARRVVVADNHIHTMLRRIGNLLHRLDTTVECDNQRTTLLDSIVNTALRYTIPLGIAVGDVVVYIGYWVLDIGRFAIG